MADFFLVEELAKSPASPKAPVSASRNIQTQPSLLDADLHDSSAWAQPFAQWNSMMSVSSTDSPVVRPLRLPLQKGLLIFAKPTAG